MNDLRRKGGSFKVVGVGNHQLRWMVGLVFKTRAAWICSSSIPIDIRWLAGRWDRRFVNIFVYVVGQEDSRQALGWFCLSRGWIVCLLVLAFRSRLSTSFQQRKGRLEEQAQES